MADGDFPFRVPDSEWTPASWIMGASSFARVALPWAGFGLLFLSCITGTHAWWGFLLPVGLIFVSVLLHELGHATAAVLGGATLLRMQVGPVVLHALRDGWRMRWKRGPREFAGLVESIPSPHRSLRRQMVAMILAGPLVNALLALVGFQLWGELDHQPAGIVLFGFGVLNAMLALANLLPWTNTMLASDGLQLWRWVRGIAHDDPQVAYTMLNARLISGELPGPWLDEYLRILERSSQPGPMIVLWTRLKALQFEGEWGCVDEVMRQVELHIIGLSPPLAKAMEGFIAVLRCEAAFSRAMAGEALAQSPTDILGPDMGWACPALRLRCEALADALDGQPERARARLAESAAWSRRSVDRSLERSEAVLREAVAARIDRACSSQAIPSAPPLGVAPA